MRPRPLGLSTRNEARGGEFARRPPLETGPGVAHGALKLVPCKSGACTPPRTGKLSTRCCCTTERSVNGLAVAAACVEYILKSEYGVAAPGLESCDLSRGQQRTGERGIG